MVNPTKPPSLSGGDPTSRLIELRRNTIDFFGDLVFGSLRRIILWTAVSTALAGAFAVWICQNIILPGEAHWILKALQCIILCVSYVIGGLAVGVSHGITSALLRQLVKVRDLITRLIEPVISWIAEQSPLASKSLSTQEFITTWNQAVASLSAIPPDSSIGRRILYRAYGWALRQASDQYLNRFTADARKRGQSQITLATVQSFVVAQLAENLAAALTMKLLLIRTLTWALAVLAAVIPLWGMR